MTNKTRKNIKCKHSNAKKGSIRKNRIKTCRTKKYQSVYGSIGGYVRTIRSLYLF